MRFSMLNYEKWAQDQWPSSSFFDPRLSKRAINIAVATLKKPNSSLPQRFSLQSDVKGCYRFLNNKAIHHQMLQNQHYENVLKEATLAPGRVLFIQDGSELIYNNLKWADLGPTADSAGNGIMFHSCLAVKLQDNQPHIIGLSGQKAWIRERSEDNIKVQEAKESQVWQEMIDRIGPVPEKCNWTTVGDRGADIFSFIKSLPEGWDCVIRSRHDRKILVDGEVHSLKKHMRGLPSMGTTMHFLRARKNSSCEVTLNISWVKAEIVPPSSHKGEGPVEGWYVRAWCEENPEIEWMLFTRSSVISFDDALEVVTIYRYRWLIEEYHKCLKTGCQIEKAQLESAEGLLALFGMLGVIATQLLQLRSISRSNPDELASKYVSKLSILVLQKIYKLKKPLTVKEYWRGIAMLVGFMGTKSDNPGWKKIWEGWIMLQNLCRGVEIGRELNREID